MAGVATTSAGAAAARGCDGVSSIPVGAGAFEAEPCDADVSRRPTNSSSTSSVPATTASATRRRRARAGTKVESASRDEEPAGCTRTVGGRSVETAPNDGVRSTTTLGVGSEGVRARRTPCSAWYAAEASPSL